ncbi:MAG: hypothetical protein K9K30_14765, partial [Burkholderiaceae bacterium]|nr:hypothetical protein [Burkholderiaceae bacterium]
SLPPLLPLLAIAALFSLLGSGVLLVVGHSSPQLAAHLAFALGVMPLILAAMGYFVPVLTRGAGAGTFAWWPPVLAWIGGALAVFAFARDFSPTQLSLAAFLGGFAAIGFGGWTLHRVKRMFGPRHRGLDWYLAALGFLVLALLAILFMPLLPQYRSALRLFHLHANLLGFVGLTVLGTLQVLLPTTLGKADPDAAVRLRRDIKWAVGGTLLIACGVSLSALDPVSEWGPVLSLPGTVLYGGVVLRMLYAWHARFGRALLSLHGAAPSLVAAALGLSALLALGVAHGLAWLPARPAVAGFVIAFLLPLVSGATAHLLPVWLRPGVQGSWHAELRTRIVRWGGVRGWLLLLLGLAIAVQSWAVPK